MKGELAGECGSLGPHQTLPSNIMGEKKRESLLRTAIARFTRIYIDDFNHNIGLANEVLFVSVSLIGK